MKREIIDTIEFKSEVVREYSYTPNRESLGIHNNKMELGKVADTHNRYYIEWTDKDSGEVFAEIGIWVDGKKVIDADGFFSFPKQAIELLNKNGFDTKEVE